MAETWCNPGGEIELRCGRWQDVLADVVACDAVITDPPYSERTHSGQRTGSSVSSPTIGYEALDAGDARGLADFCVHSCAWWSVVFTDHHAARTHEAAMESAGLYVFAPVAYIKDVYIPRLAGDGPALGVEWVLVARQRKQLPCDRRGSRPGYYDARRRRSCEPPCGIVGQKDVNVMRAIVRDYTRPGDLVVDPYAGTGTTLLACAIEGRRCIGAEVDPETYALAMRRLSAGWAGRMF